MTTPHHIRKAAKDMGIAYSEAVNARCRFLADRIADFLDYGDPVSVALAWKDIDEVVALKKTLARKIIPINDRITDEMIEAARQVPVDSLVEFSHGKARCFNHEDNNPSAFHATRTNTVGCPVCCKHWDSIGVLMTRDGYTFQDAVRRLQC